MKTEALRAESDTDLKRAVALLAAGDIVALPTETVYGLAADAGNVNAVERIFLAKGRPSTHPLIVHVIERAAAVRLATDWSETAEALARTFWPGPLTLLVRKSDAVPLAVTGGRETVAVRVPSHPVMRRILTELHALGSIGLAAPSANRFGSVSPTTAAHVMRDLDGSINAVLDGGHCAVGVESTIVDCTVHPPRVLRPGGVPTENLNEALATLGLTCDTTAVVSNDPSIAVAPGTLPSHYAPSSRLEVFETKLDLERRMRDLQSRGLRVAELPSTDDSVIYSRNLYASLRECDSENPDVIVALLPAAIGMGVAVRDRLIRASAAR